MMRRGRPRQRFRGAPLEEPPDAEPFCADAIEVEPRCPGPGDDDEVDPRREQVRMAPEALAAEPLDPVSLHGAPDPAAHHQPESRGARRALGRHEEREVRGPHPAGIAVALRARELRVLAESSIGAEEHGTRAADLSGAAWPYFL
jgi:hypothetical protein